ATAREVLGDEIALRALELLRAPGDDRPQVRDDHAGVVHDPVAALAKAQAQILFLLVQEQLLVEAAGSRERLVVEHHHRARYPSDLLARASFPPVTVSTAQRELRPHAVEASVVVALAAAVEIDELGPDGSNPGTAGQRGEQPLRGAVGEELDIGIEHQQIPSIGL